MVTTLIRERLKQENHFLWYSEQEKAFVKIKFNDFSTTTVEKMGTRLLEEDYQLLVLEGLDRKALPVRLMGLGVRLVPEKKDQLSLDIGPTLHS